jgi:hypothetical protein
LAALAESVGAAFADWAIASSARAQKRKACCRTEFQLSVHERHQGTCRRVLQRNLGGASERDRECDLLCFEICERQSRSEESVSEMAAFWCPDPWLIVRSSPKRDGTP